MNKPLGIVAFLVPALLVMTWHHAFAQAQSASAALTAPRATPTASAAGVAAADLRPEVAAVPGKAFAHPGLLHTAADFERMAAQVGEGAQPWKSGWDRLVANGHAQLGYKPRPQEMVYRGRDRVHPENYATLFNDAAAAYQCALRWRVSGDAAYAAKAVEILNGWSASLKGVGGNSDRYLASGIYGYEFANAAEIMRSWRGWGDADVARFQKMMLTVFYPMTRDFLLRHNGAKIDHYWCNWDACNMCSMLAIGVLCDRRDVYEEAVSYFKRGQGNGAIAKAVVKLYPGGLGQWQESGRDQGHSMMGVGLLGSFCEMAWNQGDDLYGYDNNRFLAGAEYVAKYNLGQDVPYTPYRNSDVTQDVISAQGRGEDRPVWEMIYNHYVKRRNLPAPAVTAIAEKVRPEGGGGDYGPNSGGFDQLGFGTLTFSP